MNGDFAGGEVTTFGLADDGVGLGEHEPGRACPGGRGHSKAQIDKIVAGEIEIPDTVGGR